MMAVDVADKSCFVTSTRFESQNIDLSVIMCGALTVQADTGRTSCVAHDILGFDSIGNIVNKPAHDGSLDWTAICTDSAKVCWRRVE